MKTITPQKLILLPLHDAAILGVCFHDLSDGFDNISFQIKINSEESLEPFQKIGFNTREVWLVFQGCSQISTSLMGFCSGREVVSSIDLIEDSELKAKFVPLKIASSSSIHFRIKGSHGSQFDILAANVSLSAKSPINPKAS